MTKKFEIKCPAFQSFFSFLTTVHTVSVLPSLNKCPSGNAQKNCSRRTLLTATTGWCFLTPSLARSFSTNARGPPRKTVIGFLLTTVGVDVLRNTCLRYWPRSPHEMFLRDVDKAQEDQGYNFLQLRDSFQKIVFQRRPMDGLKKVLQMARANFGSAKPHIQKRVFLR